MIAVMAVALVLAAPPGRDTVVQSRQGDRMVLENLSGEIVIRAWDRDEVEVLGGGRGEALAVERAGPSLIVTRGEPRRRRAPVEASIRVPSWMALDVGGLSLDVTVQGVEGELRISNLDGDVRIEGGAGEVDVRTVEGEIIIVDTRGSVVASSQSDDVTVIRASGPLMVHSGSGDLRLEDLSCPSLRAETQDGDVLFSGTLQTGGDYRFFVHDGDAVLALPASVGARVSVSTFDGEFVSDFPVLLRRFTGGREFDFTLGDGAASLRVEVFDGEIRLIRR
jgi:hypothetical protein